MIKQIIRRALNRLRNFSDENEFEGKFKMSDQINTPPTQVKNVIFEEFIPWSELDICNKERLDASKFPGQRKCPRCGIASDRLLWINYRSPKEEWENLVGREGNLSICPNCNIQVQKVTTLMN
ncbi:MAG: hypothetical protein CFE24_14655 [Flavobacterium sp. BFFFF2]|nr:MAG: hypothetical protein CFE24_14655 [Flavobacterium sp. BFFFF2]